MTTAQMKRFVELVENGLGANGEPHDYIGRYNQAIKGLLPKGRKPATSLEQVLDAGKKYMKHARYRYLAAGAVVSGVLGETVAAQAKILDVAATSGHYERALRELRNGNLDHAQRLLLDDNHSLYAEILDRAGAHAALHFKRTMQQVFADAKHRDYK